MEKVLVAMSGGVDSSVAAYILKTEGYECIGATMHLFGGDMVAAGEAGHGAGADCTAGAGAGSCTGETAIKTCCSLEDVEDARLVCNRIGIRHYTFNFEEDFRREVIDRFVRTYEEGRTPNPCIDCNKHLKFRRMFDRCRDLDCRFIATGHYARIEQGQDGRYRLRKARDLSKDQSYVLYDLNQKQLARVLFPLGDMDKTQTRKIAEEQGFINAGKKDSQDICFVPDGDYAGAIKRFTGKEYPEGDFVDTKGNVLGRHKGLIRYTIGQRKGLGLALPAPMYVLRKDTERNQVVLSSNEELFADNLEAQDMNWIDFDTPPETFRCSARIRYSHRETPATVTVKEDGSVMVKFDDPQRAVAPGQALVLYDGEYVIGGGTIVG